MNDLRKKNSAKVLAGELKISSLNEDLWIFSDRFIIGQILEKLVDNAFKFTTESEGCVEIRIKNEESNTVFSIKDFGIVINKEDQEEIFYTLNKIEHGLRFYQGVGAGLSISKQFVMLLEGKIWLESKPDKGSTFYFSIPESATKR